MQVRKLSEYMEARAKFEGVEWAMPELLLQTAFNEGVRSFFGVELSETGKLLADHQQPQFFRRYHFRHHSN
jgi:hypothetical protein